MRIAHLRGRIDVFRGDVESLVTADHSTYSIAQEQLIITVCVGAQDLAPGGKL